MPETVTAERTTTESGTPTAAAEVPAFDPMEGQSFETPESERAASGEPGDGGAAGKSATTQTTTQPDGTEAVKPGGPAKTDDGAGAGDVDELEEQLLALEGKPKGPAAGTEGTKPEATEEVEITPETLRAEIEASAQDPKERLENLLKKVGGMANNLGTERKTRKTVEAERDGYKQAFDQVAGLYEFDAAGKEIKGLNRENLAKVLDRFGMEAVAKGQRQVAAKSGAKYDSDLINEVVATLGVEGESLKEMSDEDKLSMISQNLDAALELRDRQKARTETGRKQAADVQAKFQQEMQVAAAALAQQVPHFKELQPVMEEVYAELQLVQTVHELAEFRRLRSGGLRSLVDKAKTSERAKILKSLSVLGLKPADMEAVLAGKKPDAGKSPSNGDENWIGS